MSSEIPRLFCFAHAGGSSQLFRGWKEKLAGSFDVCPVPLPGRGRHWHEQLQDRLEPLLARLYARPELCLDRRFALFGHSMGALVAFELARLLRRRTGLEPIHLFVSALRAPQTLPSPERILSALSDDDLADRLRALGGIPAKLMRRPGFLEQVLPRMLPVLRADLAVVESYRHVAAEPFNCPITALGGLRDPLADIDGLESWRDQTRGTFVLEVMDGDHFFVNSQQRRVLDVLAESVRASESGRPSERMVSLG